MLRDPEGARDSLARHGSLEAASGLRFHHRHPCLYAAGPASDLPAALDATAAALDVPVDRTPPVPPALTLPADARLRGETGADLLALVTRKTAFLETRSLSPCR